MPTRRMKPGLGRVIIDDAVFEGPVTDFTYDSEYVEDYIKDFVRANLRTIDGFTFICPVINTRTLLKISGVWQWVIDNCPNKRVVYLMQHGSERVRKKNWHRACSIISDICTEVKL